MTKALFRDTMRAIRKTMSRFVSIVIIVALGVGFYAGLKAVSPDMKAAANDFYDDLALSDIVLTSTVGFDQQDVDAVMAQPNIRQATLSRYVDGILYTADGALEQSMSGTAYVLRVIGYDFTQMAGSGAERLNQIELAEGRLPSAPNECLVSVYENSAEPRRYAIGSVVHLRGDHEDLLDSLQTTEYTVVGICYTPEFISMELGPSQAGGGELSGYIYVPDTAFLWDYYTQLYVAVSGAEKLAAYTDAYDKLVRPVKDQMEAISKDIVTSRALRLKETYEPQLIAGKAELEEKRKEAEAGLAKARKDIAALKKAVAEGPAKYREEKAKADKKIADAERDLLNGTKEYEAGYKEYNINFAKYEEARKLIEAHEDDIAAYESGKIKLEQAKASMEIAETAIRAGKSALRVANSALDSGEDQRIKNAMAILGTYFPLEDTDYTIEGLRERVAEAQADLAAQEEAVAEAKAEIAQGEKQLAEAEVLMAQVREFEAGKKELDAAFEKLEAARKELEAAPAKIEAGKKQRDEELAKAQKQLADAQALALTADDQYNKQKAEIDQQIADAERTIRRGENQLKALPDAQWIISDRDEFAGYTNYGETADNMQAFALVFPALFFLIAALVSLTTMTRMVEDERMQLGVLKAAGYSASAIAFKYLFYAFSAGFLGSAIGITLGFTLIPTAIFKAYSILYLIPGMTSAFYPGTALFGLSAAVLSTVGAVIFSVLSALRLNPAQLMRPKAPKAGKRVFLELIPPLWEKINFSGKVTVRNLMRNKKRFLMTFAGIMGCTALLLTGFGIGNSIGTMLDKQFGPQSIMRFDGQALLTAPIHAGDTETMKVFDRPGQIKQSMPIFMKNMYAGTESFGRDIEIVLAVPEYTEIDNFLNLEDDKTGKKLQFNNGGAFINGKTAELMDLQIGDMITIHSGELTAEVPVAGITRNYVYHYVYMTPAVYEKYFGVEETLFNTVLVCLEPKLSKTTGNSAVITEAKEAKAQLSRDLTDEAEVIAVVYNSAIITAVGSMIDMMRNVIVSVFTVAAGALAFIVLYNLNNINIYERVRELATIKVLGFYDGEASMYIYRENIIILILGILAGLLLGIPIHAFVIQTAEIESMMFVRTLAVPNYIAAALITIFFAVGVNALMHKKIKDISMVESLKSVE
ncbi:MAG: hypothetical protein LBB67_01200 [Oscillospiraceae bacterium]|jgi:putative ABC transport system permease protein|nr:hypothetical protein [Oscillospiraceae bacterium]